MFSSNFQGSTHTHTQGDSMDDFMVLTTTAMVGLTVYDVNALFGDDGALGKLIVKTIPHRLGSERYGSGGKLAIWPLESPSSSCSLGPGVDVVCICQRQDDGLQRCQEFYKAIRAVNGRCKLCIVLLLETGNTKVMPEFYSFATRSHAPLIAVDLKAPPRHHELLFQLCLALAEFSSSMALTSALAMQTIWLECRGYICGVFLPRDILIIIITAIISDKEQPKEEEEQPKTSSKILDRVLSWWRR